MSILFYIYLVFEVALHLVYVLKVDFILFFRLVSHILKLKFPLLDHSRFVSFTCRVNIDIFNIENILLDENLIDIHYVILSVALIKSYLNMVLKGALFWFLAGLAPQILIQFLIFVFNEFFEIIVSMVN